MTYNAPTQGRWLIRVSIGQAGGINPVKQPRSDRSGLVQIFYAMARSIMLFGNPDEFGIEFELADDPHGAWMFGSVCYWLKGNRLGDWQFSTTLRDVLFSWESIAYDIGKRENEYLFSLDTKTLVYTLHYSMYGNEMKDESVIQRAMDEQWATHEVRPVIDVFDDWHIYLVEGNGVGRFVYYHTVADVYGEGELKYGEFDLVLKEAVFHLNQCFEELSKGS